MDKTTFNLPGTIKANDENNLLWEYQGWVGRSDDIGNAEENIEDVADVQKALSQTPRATYSQRMYDPFSPLQGPPSPERKITNGGGPVEIPKVFAGALLPPVQTGQGEYVKNYTPKTSRSLRTAPAWMTRMLAGLWALLRSRRC